MIIKANNNISGHTQNIRFTVLGVMLHYTALALHSFSMNVQKPKKRASVPAPDALLGQIEKIRQKLN